jgi:hypothetical protein
VVRDFLSMGIALVQVDGCILLHKHRNGCDFQVLRRICGRAKPTHMSCLWHTAAAQK